jgi:hypothetical protein
MQPWVWVIIAVAAVLFLLLLFRRPAGRPVAAPGYGGRAVAARPWARPWARRRARRY